MKEFCLFLKDDPHTEDKRCAAGVNFVNVGPNRALCQVCPLSNLSDLPLCPNTEVYTYIRNSPEGTLIEVEFYCLANDIQPEERCQGCPDRSRQPVSVPEKDSFLISIPE
jgi:hypothetical protein